MELRTSRLVIRDLEESDRPSVVAWRSDPEVMRHLDNPEDATPDAWFDRRLASNARRPRQAYDLTIRLRRTDEPIGWIGLAWAYDGSIGDLVMGYALRRESWGQGYAAEAAGAVLAFAFGDLHAGSVFAECYEDNHRSARVLEKAGLAFDGPAPSFDPALGTSVRYIARRGVWKPRRRRRLGLIVTLGLVALLLVPLGVSAAVDRLGGPRAPSDPRLLRWTPRGELIGDRDFIDLATKVWRTFADSSSTEQGQASVPGREIDPVFAGRIGSRRFAILQSVGPTGHAVIAQVAEHGSPPELVVDRVERLDPTARAVVVAYDPDNGLDTADGGSGPGTGTGSGGRGRGWDAVGGHTTMRLVLAPGVVSGTSSRTPGQASKPSPGDPGESNGPVQAYRSVLAGWTEGASEWRDLRIDAVGLSSPWEERGWSGSTVLLARTTSEHPRARPSDESRASAGTTPNASAGKGQAAEGEVSAGGVDSVTALAVRPGAILAERPLVDLVDPSWGPSRPLDPRAYDDARQVRLWTGTQDSTVDVATLEDTALADGVRVGLFEVVADGQRSVVLLVTAGRETVCADVRPVDRLRGRSVVAASCSGSRGTFGAAAAGPGVARMAVELDGRTTRVPARVWAAALSVSPAASEAGGDGDAVGGVARAYDRSGRALGSAGF